MTQQAETEKTVERILTRYIESGKMFELLEDYFLGKAMQEVQGEENISRAEAFSRKGLSRPEDRLGGISQDKQLREV